VRRDEATRAGVASSYAVLRCYLKCSGTVSGAALDLLAAVSESPRLVLLAVRASAIAGHVAPRLTSHGVDVGGTSLAETARVIRLGRHRGGRNDQRDERASGDDELLHFYPVLCRQSL
jgi:hypothetical protein